MVTATIPEFKKAINSIVLDEVVSLPDRLKRVTEEEMNQVKKVLVSIAVRASGQSKELVEEW